MERDRRRKRVTLEHVGKPRPRLPTATLATHQPFAPDVRHLFTEPGQRDAVARDAVIGIVTAQFPAQRTMGNLSYTFALLSDPGRTAASDRCDTAARPPLCPKRGLPRMYFRGSITQLQHWLPTLRRPGHPGTTQDSLPVAGQALPDGLGYPQSSDERFQIHVMFVFLLSQAFVTQGHSTFLE